MHLCFAVGDLIYRHIFFDELEFIVRRLKDARSCPVDTRFLSCDIL